MLILSWNCAGGLRGKIDEVKLIIDKYKPSVLFINEAELKQNMDVGYLSIDNYYLLKNNLPLSRIACYIKKNLPHVVLKLKHEVDMIMLKIGEYHLTGCYRGFTIKDTCQKQHLKHILENIKMIDHPFVLIGDLNVDPQRDVDKWNGKMLQEWSIDEGMSQLIKGYTRQRVVTNKNGQPKLDLKNLKSTWYTQTEVMTWQYQKIQVTIAIIVSS